jgi:hypothetical protein
LVTSIQYPQIDSGFRDIDNDSLITMNYST